MLITTWVRYGKQMFKRKCLSLRVIIIQVLKNSQKFHFYLLLSTLKIHSSLCSQAHAQKILHIVTKVNINKFPGLSFCNLLFRQIPHHVDIKLQS